MGNLSKDLYIFYSTSTKIYLTFVCCIVVNNILIMSNDIFISIKYIIKKEILVYLFICFAFLDIIHSGECMKIKEEIKLPAQGI